MMLSRRILQLKNEIVIGLMGHSFQCANLGVGALAISECYILKQITKNMHINLKIICFEASKGGKNYCETVESKVELEYYIYSPLMIKKFRSCDVILDVTGGDSFSDIYGSKIFCAGILLKTYALLSGKPVVLAPQTIGPFYKKINGIIANIYMRFVKQIFLRDEISIKALAKYNHGKVKNTADMAFRLPYHKKDLAGERIGFNISGLLFDKNNTLLKENHLDYPVLCTQIIDMLLAHGKKVVLVSHVIGDEITMTDNDYCACLKMRDKYPQVELSPVFQNPVAAKDYISGLDFFIGSRMHAVIAAVSSGVPAVSIAYSRKFSGVFEPLGYDATLDATKMNEKEILDRVTYYVEHKEELESKVQYTYHNAQEKLKNYEEYLEKLITGILNRG